MKAVTILLSWFINPSTPLKALIQPFNLIARSNSNANYRDSSFSTIFPIVQDEHVFSIQSTRI